MRELFLTTLHEKTEKKDPELLSNEKKLLKKVSRTNKTMTGESEPLFVKKGKQRKICLRAQEN